MAAQSAGATVLENEQESDPYLIALVRGGDGAQSSAAFGKLYERHVNAAQRLARVLARDQSDADDLVAEAFTRVLSAMRAGRGPDTAFRAYVLTSLRHTLYDRTRRDKRLEYTDDLTPYEPASTPDDPLVRTLESSYAARAFARLPERWRTVLWHTEVEGESPAQVAPLLGLTPNGVAALAYRARERLRQMYLLEHIDITESPRCHWTGTHLAGYVRAQLARRDRSKVEDHLAECAECRLLHRELTEENSGLHGVLAGILLGTAAPGYLAGPAKTTAAWFAAIPAAFAMLWHHLIEWCAGLWGFVAGFGLRLAKLPRKLIERYGPGNVAAASGLVVAGMTGVTVFAAILVTGGPQPPTSLPRPKPNQPPIIAVPTAPAQLTPPTTGPTTPPNLPPLGSTGVPSAPPDEPSAATQTGRPIARFDPAQSRLTAGQSGILPIAVRAAESATQAEKMLLGVQLPAGMSLAGPDAGDGWRCDGDREVLCERAQSSSSQALLPVNIAENVTGYQSVPVAVSAGTSSSKNTIRVPVAPPGLRLGYAVSGQVGFGLGGNTLLACQPRPACLARDNNEYEMLPITPVSREPIPPHGLENRAAMAMSGARIPIPAGARIRWAGLTITASAKLAPTVAAVSGPGGGWYPLRLGLEKDASGQAFADATELVRRLGGGDWWLAARADELPSGRGAYAGWSLTVAYELDAAPPGELAIYVGPRPLKQAQRVSVMLGDGGPVDLGLVLWDGDNRLVDDSWTVDATPVGNATNAAVGANASNLVCALSPEMCAWRTPGLDVLRHKGTSGREGLATLSSGKDPMTVGLLVVLAERQQPAPPTQ